MDQKVSALDTIPAVDRAADFLYVVDSSGGTSNKVTPNTLLGITGAPVGDTDVATLSSKTLTSPTINGATLSGTLSGTYIIGGTPTFPSTVVSTTGTQTLTNKTLTSPTLTTPTINNPTLNTDAVNEFTAANGVTVDGLNVKDGKLNTNDSVVTTNITDSAVTSAKVATGMPVQMVSTVATAVSTTTTSIPFDDTVPQNTEGAELMTLSITPKSSTNILVIEAVVACGLSAEAYASIALFQDSTAGALAGNYLYLTVAASGGNIKMTHTMTAGTTSSTTFKVRGGPSGGQTFTFNGVNSSRRFGSITKSSIVITEYKA